MAGLCASFVLLAVCLCTYFEVSLQTCPPPPPSTEYYKETANFQNGNLFCTFEAQCTNDKFHGCIATAFRNFPGDMGKFPVCVYSGSSTEECGNKYHLIWRDDIEKCVEEGRGAQLCNDFHTRFVDAKTKQSGDTAQVPCAITNFKETTCWVLGQAGLKCDAVCSK